MKSRIYGNWFELSYGQVLMFHSLLLLLKMIWVSVWSLELHYEEAQYWLWSKHLDWSYYSKPGMVAWMNYISTSILGDTNLAVKLPAIVAGFVTSIGIYHSAKQLYNDQKIATLSSLLLYFMPYYYSISLFHSTDSFLVAFGAFSYYYFIKAIHHNLTKDWVLCGLFLGLATLSKYSGLIIAATYLIYLTIYKRHLLKRFALTALVLLLLMMPIFIWNFNNDFVTFKHVSGLAGTKKAPTFSRYFNSFFEFVGGQIAIISPFLFIFLIKAHFQKSKKLWATVFPACVSFIIFFLLWLKNAKAPNVNWPFFNYAPLAIFFSVALVQSKRLSWLRPVGLLMTLLFWIISNTNHIDQIGLGQLLPPQSDPTSIYHQWRGPAEQIAANNRFSNKLLLCDSYKTTSALQFYLGDRQHIIYQNAGSRQNQLDYWDELKNLNTEGQTVNFIYSRAHFPEKIADQYDNIALVDSLTARWRGQNIKTFYIFQATANQKLTSITKGY